MATTNFRSVLPGNVKQVVRGTLAPGGLTTATARATSVVTLSGSVTIAKSAITHISYSMTAGAASASNPITVRGELTAVNQVTLLEYNIDGDTQTPVYSVEVTEFY